MNRLVIIQRGRLDTAGWEINSQSGLFHSEPFSPSLDRATRTIAGIKFPEFEINHQDGFLFSRSLFAGGATPDNVAPITVGYTGTDITNPLFSGRDIDLKAPVLFRDTPNHTTIDLLLRRSREPYTLYTIGPSNKAKVEGYGKINPQKTYDDLYCVAIDIATHRTQSIGPQRDVEILNLGLENDLQTKEFPWLLFPGRDGINIIHFVEVNSDHMKELLSPGRAPDRLKPQLLALSAELGSTRSETLTQLLKKDFGLSDEKMKELEKKEAEIRREWESNRPREGEPSVFMNIDTREMKL